MSNKVLRPKCFENNRVAHRHSSSFDDKGGEIISIHGNSLLRTKLPDVYSAMLESGKSLSVLENSIQFLAFTAKTRGLRFDSKKIQEILDGLRLDLSEFAKKINK